MDKILHTQMTNVFNTIENQEEEIEIAARLLAQATMSEGNILLKTFNEATFFEDYFLHNDERIPSIQPFHSIEDITTPDRLLIITKEYTEEVKAFVDQLDDEFIDYVLVSNTNKDNKAELEEKHHFIDLSSKRKLVPMPDFDRVLNPYGTAFLFIYYHLYILIEEMTNPKYE
ncbi:MULTISPECIES: DUF2529 family protein [Nosocomiicoccus]|uniref:DUF2529 family protein n=1 Tax=Nosocomiicoccus TaxID=489909 RepID=UPI0008A38F9B|nr:MULTISPECIES: DUF2529 family protein [Nosocomiicoccus]MDK6863707.1 DUF2529 family protein [Nosocomiicoccus ampullae]OFL48938.1 hypothetical protein HMPREF2767_06730 [Nosocomiicoccus sp. HMSC067E10]OFO54349.1 hypothetical protein HMPREF3029_00500 [Nosocomiicoccus sp. HMSC059G07]OFS63526.1 hypothetical protein HMPREF3177_02990 [Nosocomiicoccus sp. HMSC09A07]